MKIQHQPAERIFQMILSLLAIIPNSILFWLICRRSPPGLGGYKFLMMYFALFEIFYAIFDFFSLPYFYSEVTGFLIFLDPIFDLPRTVVQALIFGFCGSFAMLMAMFSSHFVFRYCVFRGIKSMTSTEPLVIVFWILVPIFVGLVWTTVCYAFFGENPMTYGFLAYGLGERTDMPYVGPFFDFRLDYHANSHVYNGLALTGLIGLICFFTIFYFGFKCYAEVRALVEDSTRSETYKSLQAQLFYVLVSQAMIPFLCIFLPIAVLAVSICMGGSRDYFGKTLTLSNAIYPVLDPLPNMLMIKSYRTALTSWRCHRARRRVHTSSPVNNVSFIGKL